MSLTERDFTREFCLDLVEKFPTLQDAAIALAPQCVSERYHRPVAWNTVRWWIKNALRQPLARAADPDRVNRVDELLERANIDVKQLGAIKRATLSSWGYAMKVKRADGSEEPIEGGLYKTQIDVVPPNPEFPVLQPAPTTTFKYNAAPRILRKTRMELIVSDVQAGWLRDTKTDQLEPIHDPDAIDVAQQITADVAPDGLTFVGDLADLAMFSRWPQHPEYRGTLQAAINVTHEICGGFIVAAGKRLKTRRVIGSNHDHRIEKSVLEWNKEALGVRRAGEVEGWPVFSLGYLARFDDLGLEWTGQFPGGEFYLLDDLVIMHAPPKRHEFRASVIHGHLHKITRTTAVQHAHTGRCTSFVYDVGCLCRVGSTTDKFRLLVTNTPSDRGRTDWAQGIAVVSIVEASGSRPAYHAVEQIAITDGIAHYGGKFYQARSLAEAVA